jgi:hypothetical protein
MPSMSENSQPNKSPEPTPEQLLKLLDLQIAAARSRKRGNPRNRVVLAVAAVFIIFLGALVALFLLQTMVEDMPRSTPAPEPPADLQKSR